MSRLSRLVAGATAGLAVVVAGCGGGSSGKTETVTAPATSTAAPPTTAAATTAPTATTSVAGSDPLTGVEPPSGSVKLGSASRNGTSWLRYSTGVAPKAVVAGYADELTKNGWTVKQAGGHGGGWGPYGGSGAGLTAKKAGKYADLQAGAARGGKTYFELCAGSGSRGLCDRLSTKADSSSSGSHPAGNDPTSSSGAS